MRWLLAVAALAAGCETAEPTEDGEGSGWWFQPRGQVVVAPTAVSFDPPSRAAGGEATRLVYITNTGDGALHVSRITLQYSPPPGVVEAVPALSLDHEVANVAIPPGGPGIEVSITYHRPADDAGRLGTLEIVSDTRYVAEQHYTILVNAGTRPSLTASPAVLDFGTVHAGETAERPLAIANSGSMDVNLDVAAFSAMPGFRLFFAGTGYDPGALISPGLRLVPGQAVTLNARYSPTGPDPAGGFVAFHGSAGALPAFASVTLRANDDAVPCLDVTPNELQFGVKAPGPATSPPVVLTSCGSTPLTVTAIRLLDGGTPDFALDGPSPTPEAPLVILPGEHADVRVVYTPSNAPVLAEGVLAIDSDAFYEHVEIDVSALDTGWTCPVAVVSIDEGEVVPSQTVLHFHGDQSYAPPGKAVAAYQWTAVQPPGSAIVFVPSDTFPNPALELNVVGTYHISLSTHDDLGVKSCLPAVADVKVVPDQPIHIELTWHTPGDPDESDQGPEAGSDLDLHVLDEADVPPGMDADKDGQPDGWFAKGVDCWWFEKSPPAGVVLTRDDTDGAGPEIAYIAAPQQTTYRIGVHAWAEHDYGPSVATLRVYVAGELALEVEAVLAWRDMWTAATLDWPSGAVTTVGTVLPNYPLNDFMFP